MSTLKLVNILLVIVSTLSSASAKTVEELAREQLASGNILMPSGMSLSEEIEIKKAKLKRLNKLISLSDNQIYITGLPLEPVFYRDRETKICHNNSSSGYGHPLYICGYGEKFLYQIKGGKYNVMNVNKDNLRVQIDTVFDEETETSITPKEFNISAKQAIFPQGCSEKLNLCSGQHVSEESHYSQTKVIGIYLNDDVHVVNSEGRDYRLYAE